MYDSIDILPARTDGCPINSIDGQYCIEVGNLGEQDETIAIILLDNGTQVPLSSLHPYMLFTLEPQQETMIHIQEYIDRIQKDSQLHDLCVVRFNESGEVNDLLYGKRLIIP